MPLMICLSIMGVGLGVYWRTRCWSHPAVVFALFWCAAAALPIIAVPDAPSKVWAPLFLLAATMAFAAPSFFMDWERPRVTAIGRRQLKTPIDRPWMIWMAFALQTLPVIFAVLNIEQQGFALSDVLTQPVMVACQYLGARYSGLIQPTIYSQLGTVLNYVGAPIVGILLAVRSKWLLRIPLFIVCFIPSLIAVTIYADKGTVFLTAALLLAGTVVGRMSMGNTALLTRNTIIGAVAGILIIVPIISVAMLNRGGGDCGDAERTSKIMAELAEIATNSNRTGDLSHEGAANSALPGGLSYYLRSYAFAHLFAFSDWFESYLGHDSIMTYDDPPHLTLGFWTGMALLENFYPNYDLPDGYYAEYFEIPGLIKTNIYTMYRGMIYDFGIVGSLLFVTGLGGVSAIAYRRMLNRASTPSAQAFYVFLAGMIYSSYIISIGVWTSPIAASFLLLIILTINSSAEAHFAAFSRRRQ
jgi:hypothetical protein